MIIKPSSTPTSVSTSASASASTPASVPASVPPSASSTHPTSCGNCGVEEKWLLHHVHDSGMFRRLCTTCVLRLNPLSFCPSCFTVYDASPFPSGPNDPVTCLKCYSSSHGSCVGPNVPSPYICPLCINPDSPIFILKKVKGTKLENSHGSNGKEVCIAEYRIIDKKAARILLAAAKIASVNMNKAAAAAREDAVRRAKEAAISRKRAKEALEHVAYLVAKEKFRKKEVAAAAKMLGPRASAAGGSVGSIQERSSNVNHIGSNININGRGGNVNGGVTGLGMAGEEKQRFGNLGRVDRSNGLLSTLNAVELREEEKMAVMKVENPVLGQSSNGVVPMDVDVEESGGIELNPGLIDGAILDDHSAGSGIERSGNLDHMENYGEHGKNVSNGSVMVPPTEDQVKNRADNQPGSDVQRLVHGFP